MTFARKIALALCCILISCSMGSKTPARYVLRVVREFPHDSSAYTQGLFFSNGSLYESTGQYGSSSFRKVELETGKVLERISFSRKYFGEGSVILGDKLYILTWTNKVLFVYDAASLKYLQSYSYPREGWGLTTDGKSLIASDGSSRIYFLSPDLKLERSINVTMNGRPIRLLNELEYIDGKIWANVYTTDVILIIDPSSGEVEGTINCSGLLPEKLRTPSTDVLNGIAKNPSDGRIYLTGKNWPRLYEIVLVPSK